MAEVSIDALEAIDVETNHGEACARGNVYKRLLDPLLQESAIG